MWKQGLSIVKQNRMVSGGKVQEKEHVGLVEVVIHPDVERDVICGAANLCEAFSNEMSAMFLERNVHALN